MRKLCGILILLALWNCKASKHNDSKVDQKTIDRFWTESSKTISSICDTLILREICDYCNGETSNYYPHKFGPTTSCICYGFNEYSDIKINEFIKKHSLEIHYISIENPIGIITKLNFRNLKQLQTLEVFGNDYNSTSLKTLPNELLKLSKLRNLVFDGVLFPSTEIGRITKKYPKLKFIGEISEPH